MEHFHVTHPVVSGVKRRRSAHVHVHDEPEAKARAAFARWSGEVPAQVPASQPGKPKRIGRAHDLAAARALEGGDVDNSDLNLPIKDRRPDWQQRLAAHLRRDQASLELNPLVKIRDPATGWSKAVRQSDVAKETEAYLLDHEKRTDPTAAAFRKINSGLYKVAELGTKLIPGAAAAKTAWAVAKPSNPSKVIQGGALELEVPEGHCSGCGQKKPRRKRASPAADSKTARRAALVKKLCAEGMSVPQASHKIKAEGLEY